MHERKSWAGVNGQVTKGRCPQTWMSFRTVLRYISSQSSVLTQPKGSGSTFSKWCASPRGPLCDSISCEWECWMTTSNTSLCWRTAPRLYQWRRKKYPFWQSWSSRHSAGICPDVMAESVQPQPLNGSWVNLYVATGPWGHRGSHGWETEQETQGKG